MSPGILGKKIGMTQVFRADGQVVPVTVLKAGPCVVVQRKTPATDGYDAVQLGLMEYIKKTSINKPQAGYALRAQTSPTGSGVSAESTQFDVQIGEFTGSTSTLVPTPMNQMINVNISLGLTAHDAGGNGLEGVEATFSVTPGAGCQFVYVSGAGANVWWERSEELDEFAPGVGETRQMLLWCACGEAFSGRFVLF